MPECWTLSALILYKAIFIIIVIEALIGSIYTAHIKPTLILINNNYHHIFTLFFRFIRTQASACFFY